MKDLPMPEFIWTKKDHERFWKKVDKQLTCTCHSWKNRCWLWTASCARGYGQFRIKSITNIWYMIKAHQVAWIFQTIPPQIITDDIHILHTPPCINKRCIRHIYSGTNHDNQNDTKIMNLYKNGEHLPQSKFTHIEINQIRTAWLTGLHTHQTLATIYEVNKSTIGHIVRYETYKHLP